MTNEELMCHLAGGDESVLEELCAQNMGLIRSRALKIAAAYNCVQFGDRGQHTNYTKETLSDLESVGVLAFLKCVWGGAYDSSQGTLTYVVPFLDAAMRRHLERSMGSLSLDRNSMSLVRNAQRLSITEGKCTAEIAAELGIPLAAVARHIAYPTHFLSVYDLADLEEAGDVFDYIAEDTSGRDPADIIYRQIRSQYLRELFGTLSKKEQDVLGKSFGVFGYPKLPLRDIAMYHMIKEDAIERIKKQALEKLREQYPDSMMHWWKIIHGIIGRLR